MEFWGFWAVSTIEMTSIFLAMFALFRFSLPYLVKPILFFSMLLSVVSYMLFVIYQIPTAPWIQIGITIIFFWTILDIPFFYAALMLIIHTAMYMVFQGVLFWISGPFLEDKQILFDATSWQVYMLQLICSFFNLLVIFICVKTRIGFSFVPTDRIGKFQWSWINLKLGIGMVVAVFMMMASYFFYAFYKIMMWIPLIIFSCVSFILLWLSYYKENNNND